MNNKKIPQICGFNKCSEAGIDVFAPAIFLNRCNFRCPYCMNAKLARGKSDKSLDIEEIKQYVKEDKSEWFMISGGEPLCGNIPHLINLLKEIQTWGCKIGISTNGSYPRTLKRILPLINYIAMDFKAVLEEDYKEFGNGLGSSMIIESKNILMENKKERDDFDYEVRTTLYPKYIDKEAMHEIGSVMRKDDTWVLQQFRHVKNMLDTIAYEVEPYSKEEVESLVKIAKEYSDNVRVRYV